jgi:hypothetical protein
VDTGPSATALAPLAEINELALELMTRRAAGVPAGLHAVLRDSVELWRALTPEQGRRIAGCPFLLVEIDVAALSAGGGVRDSGEGEHWFEEQSLPRLAYLTLTYAWHIARSRPLAARIVLGLHEADSAWLAGLTLRELGACIEIAPALLRPRWLAHPEIWRHLLSAAASAAPAEFELARLRGMQLLAAPWWPADPRRPRLR